MGIYNLKSLPSPQRPIFIYIPLLVETNVYGAVALDSWPSERFLAEGVGLEPTGVLPHRSFQDYAVMTTSVPFDVCGA